MKRIDRYIFDTVIGTSLLALLVLVVLESFFALLAELEDLGRANYGLAAVFQYLLLTLPRRIYETVPMALLLGGLLGMGALASSSELVVMRVAGCSLLRLVGAALRAALLLGLIALQLGEFVVPQTEKLAQESRAYAQQKSLSVHDEQGFWARDGNAFINVRAILPGDTLSEIYVYEIDEKSDLKYVARAEVGRFVNGKWVLEAVNRNVMMSDRVLLQHVPSMAVEGSVISPDLLKVLAAEPIDLSLRELLYYIDYRKANHLDSRTYELAFWLKVISPLTNMALLFVAMPVVFGPQRTAGAGQRLLIGVVLGLVFFLLNRMLSNLVLLYGYHPLLGASLPTLLFFAGGAYALLRIR